MPEIQETLIPDEYKWRTPISIKRKAIDIYGRRAVLLPKANGINLFRRLTSAQLTEYNKEMTFRNLRYKMRTSLPQNKLVSLQFTVHAVNASGGVIASKNICDLQDPNANPNYWVTGANGTTDWIKLWNGDYGGKLDRFHKFLEDYSFNPNVSSFIITYEPINFKNAQTGYTIYELEFEFITYNSYVSLHSYLYNKPGIIPQKAPSNPIVTSLNISDRIVIKNLRYDYIPGAGPQREAVLFYQQSGGELKSSKMQINQPPKLSGWGNVDSNFVEYVFEFPPNTLSAGEFSFDARASDHLGGDLRFLSGIGIGSVQLVDTRPTIVTLEPSGVVLDIGKAITVSWESTGQESFRLDANGNTFTGTTEKSVQIPANTFRKGENRITLKLKNNTAEFAERSKTVTFIGYGKPSLPVIAEQTIYNTARPTITWTSDEQHTYNLKIYKGSQMIKDSGDVVSSTPSYKVPANLQNNTDYTIKLKVKNDRGLWSDEAVKTIRISFSELKPATLTLYASNRGTVTVNVTNPTDATFAHCEVWRKRSYDTEWTRIAKEAPITAAFSDQLLAANTEYQYKVISYNKQGGAVESAIKTVTVEVPEMEFIDLSTMQKIASGYAESPDEPFSRQRVQDRQLMRFEGLKAPVMEIGETDYSVINFSLSFRRYADLKQFEAEANRAKLLLFRSTQGHLHFGLITDWGNEKISATGITSIDFTFTEMEFVSGEIYVAGQQVGIVLTDQGYTFGG